MKWISLFLNMIQLLAKLPIGLNKNEEENFIKGNQ